MQSSHPIGASGEAALGVAQYQLGNLAVPLCCGDVKGRFAGAIHAVQEPGVGLHQRLHHRVMPIPHGQMQRIVALQIDHPQQFLETPIMPTLALKISIRPPGVVNDEVNQLGAAHFGRDLKWRLLLRVRLVQESWAEPRSFFEEADSLELGRDVKDGVSLRGHLREQSGVPAYPLED